MKFLKQWETSSFEDIKMKASLFSYDLLNKRKDCV